MSETPPPTPSPNAISLEVIGHRIVADSRPALGESVEDLFDSALLWLQDGPPCTAELARCHRELGDAGGDGGECLVSHFEQLTPRCQAALREQWALSPPEPRCCRVALLAASLLLVLALACRRWSRSRSRSRSRRGRNTAKERVIVVVESGPARGVQVCRVEV